MTYVLENLPWFIVFIGVLVFVHELGHFLLAKACGVKVLRFSLGFGPRLFGFRGGETDYCVSALPLGGYVKMLGELPGVEIPPEDAARAFGARPVWQRAAILAAGPMFNFVLAVVVYFGMLLGPQTFGDTKLGFVAVGEPAWRAGLRAGDKIVAIAGEPVREWEDLRRGIGGRPGKAIAVAFERDGTRHEVTLEPRAYDEVNPLRETERRGRIGVSLQFLRPVIAIIDPMSPAALAGLKTDDIITKVGDVETAAWHEVRQALRGYTAGEPIRIAVKRGADSLAVELRPAQPLEGLDPDLFSSADAPKGGYTGLVNKDCLVVELEPGTPAAKAGLLPGDRLVGVAARDATGRQIDRLIGIWRIDLAALDGVPLSDEVLLTIQRSDQVLQRRFRLAEKEETDEFKNKRTVRVFGATNDPAVLDTYVYERARGPFEAFGAALTQVGEDATIIVKGIAKVMKGDIPLETMGGPIMLFVIAEKTAKKGLVYFLRMLAMISVNLGILNLLPVPVLDGGHLVFCAIEAVRRRPPSVRARELANVVGIALLLLMMAIVFRNDILRYVLG